MEMAPRQRKEEEGKRSSCARGADVFLQGLMLVIGCSRSGAARRGLWFGFCLFIILKSEACPGTAAER